MRSEAAEAIAASVGSKVTYGGGGLAFLGGLTSHDVIAVAGLAVGFIGALVNWYYKGKADRRYEREHTLRVRRLEMGRRTDTDFTSLEADE